MHNNYTTIKYKFYTIPHILSLKTRQSPSVGRWRKTLERDRARERAFRGQELFRAPAFPTTSNNKQLSGPGNWQPTKEKRTSVLPAAFNTALLRQEALSRRRLIQANCSLRRTANGGKSWRTGKTPWEKSRARFAFLIIITRNTASESGKLLREWKRVPEKGAERKVTNTQINHKLRTNKSQGNRPIKKNRAAQTNVNSPPTQAHMFFVSCEPCSYLPPKHSHNGIPLGPGY